MLTRDRPWLGFQDDSFLQSYGGWVLDYWAKFHRAPDAKRERLCLFSNATAVENIVAKDVEATAAGRRHLRPLPAGITFSSSIWVVGDYIVTLQTRTPPHLCMVFRDPGLSENLANVFLFLWGLTKQE
jgi:hypothetical protein